MQEHAVQVVISEPGGRRVQVDWRGVAAPGPLRLQVTSTAAASTAAFASPAAPAVVPRHELFPAATAELAAPGAAVTSVELLFPASAPITSTPEATARLSLQLRWADPPPPAPKPKPATEQAPLATAWAVERLRQRHLASSGTPPRRRVARTPER